MQVTSPRGKRFIAWAAKFLLQTYGEPLIEEPSGFAAAAGDNVCKLMDKRSSARQSIYGYYRCRKVAISPGQTGSTAHSDPYQFGRVGT